MARVDPSTISKWVNRGIIPPEAVWRAGRTLRLRRDVIEAWLSQAPPAPTPQPPLASPREGGRRARTGHPSRTLGLIGSA